MLTFIAALVGSILGTLGTAFTLRFHYKQLYAETVSRNRMEWINIWRKSIAKFLACAETLLDKQIPINEALTLKRNMYEARGMITSRLNLTEHSHAQMLVLINNISNCTNRRNFVIQREAVLSLARKILKPEWERVKAEARGKR